MIYKLVTISHSIDFYQDRRYSKYTNYFLVFIKGKISYFKLFLINLFGVFWWK